MTSSKFCRFRNRFFNGLSVVALTCTFASPVMATLQDDRLDEIEDAIERIEGKIGSRAVVQGFDAKSLTIGGFLHSALTSIKTEDNAGNEGGATAFNRQIFELLIRARFDENWSAFIAQAFFWQSEINYYDAEQRLDPYFQMQLNQPLVIAWANYSASNAFNVQFGRFITPQGIINIDHFPAILLDTEQPQFLRPFGGQTMFPNFINGIQFHGRSFFGKEDANTLQYNLFSGSFSGTEEEAINGARVAVSLGGLGMTLGLNGAKSARTENVSPDPNPPGKIQNPDSDYTLSGVDLLIDKGFLLWKSELWKSDEEAGGDKEAYYTQPAIRLSPKWLVFVRHDFLDNGAGTGDTIENMFGINYTPKTNIRLRATVTDKEFEASPTTTAVDAMIYQLSATLSF